MNGEKESSLKIEQMRCEVKIRQVRNTDKSRCLSFVWIWPTELVDSRTTKSKGFLLIPLFQDWPCSLFSCGVSCLGNWLGRVQSEKWRSSSPPYVSCVTQSGVFIVVSPSRLMLTFSHNYPTKNWLRKQSETAAASRRPLYELLIFWGWHSRIQQKME